MRQISNVRRITPPTRIAWRQAADEVLIAAIFGGTAGARAADDPREARRVASRAADVVPDARGLTTAH